ncbi:hypothetical protein JI59_05965 [Novosphingobium pentaromativorans US6-1]|uniref:Uncharacterized protein n=1 Tax=Novosphingobium pentaromativorans US6-1 TaxID=1088721 RepID=G6EEQ6_9SPHN|nr:hypothetical protein JI59_05965 [Novosphingobium pentaromativorans US6-1]EHJ60202.1 hypothetical protein NSU_2827 [Novosphingobium pentaromativorans US6-1]
MGLALVLAPSAQAQDLPIEGMWNYRVSEWTDGASVPQPELTQEAKDLLARKKAAERSGYTRSVASMICLPIGFPGVMFFRTPIQILAGAGRVAITAESAIEPRTVYLDIPHPDVLDPSWYGNSVGHWESGDLIVDTVGLNGRGKHHGIWQVGRDLPGTSDQAHIVERFHVEPDGQVLTMTMTVEDPVYYAKPYSVTVHYDRMPNDSPRYEAVCEVDFDALAKVDLEAIKDIDVEAERMLDPNIQYNPIDSSK